MSQTRENKLAVREKLISEKPINVFVSVGNTTDPNQEAFIAAIEKHLRDNGLNPRTIGRSDFSSIQPLKFIEQVMQECYGTLVLAFERVLIKKGLERGTEPISNTKLPSVWNQVEAGMAYVLKHPLMVIVENGIRAEGILEFGYDWYVQRVDVNPLIVEDQEFKGVFEDWKERVTENYLNKNNKTIQNG